MNAEFLRSYKSKKGNTTFVYRVSGTDEELDAYTEAQGEYITIEDETGIPLWFTTRYIGERGSLIITNNGNVIADMSEFQKIESLTSQFDGPLGQIIAQRMLDNMLTSSATPQTPTSQAALPAAEEAGENLDVV